MRSAFHDRQAGARADVQYLLLGRTAPRYRGTELSEVWQVDCVDVARTARGFDRIEDAGAALGSDVIEPLGRALSVRSMASSM